MVAIGSFVAEKKGRLRICFLLFLLVSVCGVYLELIPSIEQQTLEGHNNNNNNSIMSASSSSSISSESLTDLIFASRVLRPVDAKAEEEENKHEQDVSLVSVLQFNLLSDTLGENGGFIKTSPEVLDYESHRKHQHVAEIVARDPDIACLQEVDHFADWMEPQLRRRGGYEGLFLAKQSSPCTVVYGKPADGVALFYKKQIFDLLDSWTFSYSEVEEKTGQILEDNQGAIVAMLERSVTLRSSSSSVVTTERVRICVATTHLKASKDQQGEQARQRQAKQLLDRVQEIVREFQQSEKGSDGVPVYVVVMGDMNASPQDAKGRKALFYPVMTQHELDLYSAYGGGKLDPMSKDAELEPPFTTWKFRPGKEAKHTIDYIFFKPVAMHPRQEEHDNNAKNWHEDVEVRVSHLLDIPSETTIGENGLPAHLLASDHVNLMACLVLRRT